jgi:hypothetical protein
VKGEFSRTFTDPCNADTQGTARGSDIQGQGQARVIMLSWIKGPATARYHVVCGILQSSMYSIVQMSIATLRRRIGPMLLYLGAWR